MKIFQKRFFKQHNHHTFGTQWIAMRFDHCKGLEIWGKQLILKIQLMFYDKNY